MIFPERKILDRMQVRFTLASFNWQDLDQSRWKECKSGLELA